MLILHQKHLTCLFSKVRLLLVVTTKLLTLRQSWLLALALRFAEGPTVERARDLFRATLGYLPLAWGRLLLDSLW